MANKMRCYCIIYIRCNALFDVKPETRKTFQIHWFSRFGQVNILLQIEDDWPEMIHSDGVKLRFLENLLIIGHIGIECKFCVKCFKCQP